MIAVDTNLLVYAFRRDAPEHEQAAAAVTELVTGRLWALPWSVVHEFLRVVTARRGSAPGAPPRTAMAAVESWLATPGVRVLAEGPGHWLLLQELVERSEARGARVYDARIAAVCLAHGVSELWTADRDFSRFAQLRTRNPLAG